MDNLTLIIQEIFTFNTIILLLLGAVIGLIFGSLPGLTATMGVAVLLPITFSLDAIEGIVLLIGVYVGGISGGLVAATLLGIPGTPSSIATTFDAYPMTKNGEPVRALGIGIVGSLVGGILSFIVLIAVAPIIASLAVKLTQFDYAALIFFALALISVLSKGNIIKGITSGFIGLSIALIGFAPIDRSQRFTFGNINLGSGIELLPLMLGLFAIAIILISVQEKERNTEINFKVKGLGVSLKEFFNNTWNMIRSSIIGIGFGILPGMGSGISNIISYAQAKQSSKNPEEFGKGSPEGIYASETSNNASIGGALVPLLALGIPGDTVTAILLGGFVIQGIQPGPLLMQQNPGVVQAVYIAFLLSIIVVFLLQLFGMRLFPLILKIPKNYLFGILVVLSAVGAFSDSNNTFDIWVMLVFGVIGYVLMRNNYPIAPLILGYILGPLFETYLRRALMNSPNGMLGFLTHPIAAILVIITFIVIIRTFYKEFKEYKQVA